MLKKIILTFILFILAQQEFYGSDNNSEGKKETKISDKEILEQKYYFWIEKNNKIRDFDRLWVFLDNVPFQYGSSKVWKHGEAYYGLSNGIGFFHSFLNFGWMKIGIGDAHINVINAIINYIRIYVEIKRDYYYRLMHDKKFSHKNSVWFNSLKWWVFYTLVTDTQLLSFKFFNCVKIKIISIGAIVTKIINKDLLNDDDNWFFYFNFYLGKTLAVPSNFFVFSTRIEINISELINYFKKQ